MVLFIFGMLILAFGITNMSYADEEGAGKIIRDQLCKIMKLLQGPFGALVTVVAGLAAVVTAAMGGYKLVIYFLKKTKEISVNPRKIGWTETIILALVLALDGIAVGFGASIYNTSLLFCLSVVAFSLVTDFVFFIFGHHLGKRLTKKTRLDLSWLSGAVLIILGIIRLF